MSWANIAVAAASVVGGVLSSNAAKKGASAQSQANNAAIAEQQRQYDQSRQDLAPWRTAGSNALAQMQTELGLTSPTAPVSGTETSGPGFDPSMYNWDWNGGWAYGGANGKTNPGFDYRGNVPANTTAANSSTAPVSGFKATPGYEFVRSEGQRGLERSAAARGGAFSGNALRALDTFNNGLASQEYNNYYNRLAALSGTGQTATTNTAELGANAASRIGGYLQDSGMARASGIAGANNAWGQTITSLASIYGNYLGKKG